MLRETFINLVINIALCLYISYRKSWAVNLLMWLNLILGPSLQGQMTMARLKSGYNSLIIGPRGLQCETNL